MISIVFHLFVSLLDNSKEYLFMIFEFFW